MDTILLHLNTLPNVVYLVLVMLVTGGIFFYYRDIFFPACGKGKSGKPRQSAVSHLDKISQISAAGFTPLRLSSKPAYSTEPHKTRSSQTASKPAKLDDLAVVTTASSSTPAGCDGGGSGCD